MSNQLSTIQLQAFLAKKVVLPTMPVFNRLEARPRTHDFDQALRAEVRDALWMLTKQWQMGEFKGDDAGSPMSSKVYIEKTMLTKYKPAEYHAEPFNDKEPLEARVERRNIPFKSGDIEISLDLRLIMGRHWARLLDKNGFDLLNDYIQKFPVYQPDPDNREDKEYCASQLSWCKHAATAGRHVDGKKLYDDIVEESGRHVLTVDADPDVYSHSDLIALGQRFRIWFETLFFQPQPDAPDEAWLPSKLEYQFACSAPKNGGETVYTAEEYYHGHLDWYNLSIDPETDALDDVEPPSLPEDFSDPIVRSFIPTPVQFDGMPNTRWWSFEEGKTNFGDIRPDTTDINKLLLIEFGLIYANDWYLLPVTLPAGTIANVRGMSVKNVFGENIWIGATGAGLDDNPDRWTMYSMDIAGDENKAADLSLMVVPSVPKIQEGEPIEEINLVRDEVANMVWGIETRIPLPSGDAIPGHEAARDLLRHINRIISETTTEDTSAVADLRYKIMSSIPENWIPFIATHEEGSNRETCLQRGSMPRIIEGDPQVTIDKIKPRTSLLRVGLDQEEKQSYFINEEEVLRAGTDVTQSFQRTRWYSGQVYNWLGVRKRTGRGEASSQLRFDYLQQKQVKTTEPE